MFLKKILVIGISCIIGGCSSFTLMNPKGQIGLEQYHLIILVCVLMLFIVIPVLFMTVLFFKRYSSSNTNSVYDPKFINSNKLEIMIWIIPMILIAAISIIIYKSTNDLDPSKPINNSKTINIKVVSLNWKWLFIYPEEKIASVNELAFPANTQIKFEITSGTVMNSFFIPQLGSQIYAMPGMNSKLYLIANKPGEYKGISSNFSGYGFSKMKFRTIVFDSQNKFNLWIKKIKNSSNPSLENIKDYEYLLLPNHCSKIKYFSEVKFDLFKTIIDKFMHSNTTVIKE